MLPSVIGREVGQHFVVGFDGIALSEDIKSLITEYHVGSVILMKRNVESSRQVHSLITELQQLAKDSAHVRPLLIGIDQENGMVSAFSLANGQSGTQFPGAMALAATNSKALVEAVNLAAAAELKAVGFNWAYSPVADVNSDPRNPVIGVRSFGDNAEKVGEYAIAVAKGMSNAGVAPSAKHFPGHGDTHIDSHMDLPRILKTSTQLMATELVPFRALIAEGVETIMTGHMALPLVTGSDIPCSLSALITTDLLRTKLGFQGVVVTDCLEMDAVVAAYGSEQGAVMALRAGADIAMICHTVERQKGAIHAALLALEKGELESSALKSSRERINALKDKFAGTWEDVLGKRYDAEEFSVLKEKSKAVSGKAYTSSISLIVDAEPVLPLKTYGQTIVFTPMMESLNAAMDDADGVDRFNDRNRSLHSKNRNLRKTAGSSYIAFASSIAARAKSSEHFVYVPHGRPPPALRNASAVVFVTRNADRRDWQIDYLRAVLTVTAVTGAQVVLLASCAPYDLMNTPLDIPVPESEALSPRITIVRGDLPLHETTALQPLLDIRKVAYLASFELTPPALEAAAAVIYGERKAMGTVPVLNGKVLATSTSL